jgi:methionyl-tRNA formyltransferase
MRIVFIGCVEFSHIMLKHLLSSVPDAEVIGVVTRKQSAFNSDFHSLEDIALSAQIPLFFAEGNNQVEIVEWMKKLHPDIAYCFGWSYLLGSQLLNIPRLGILGYHPAALPQNRGRHPIIWALVLGLSETASTFFFMDEGADSGDILSQNIVRIDPNDAAADLYNKLIIVAKNQVNEFTAQLSTNNYHRIPQDNSIANYWRKRKKSDGQIDWRISACTINNLVRALAKPYPGAHCLHNDCEIKIWKSEIVDSHNYINIEPGKVIKVEGKDILVKCGDGLLKLLSHEFTLLPIEGSYL